MSASDDRLWIEADGRVWGPYPASSLPRFRDEGRIDTSSRVGRAASGPFSPIAHDPDLAGLFDDAPGAPESEAEPLSVKPSLRPLLVMTDADAETLTGFEVALQGHGEAVRVRSGLWLVRAGASAAALRNTLSRSLRATDTLMVVEAPLAGAAWFNLDGQTDRALRRLWAEAAFTPGASGR